MNTHPTTSSRRNATGLRVAVVGGSLTGPTAALLLQHAGFDDVTLYEAAPASAPLGGGLIGLEHSSLDILDQLGVPQHEFVRYDSETVMDITVCGRRPGSEHRHLYAGRNTTWTLLHTALTRRLPTCTLHTGNRVTGLTGEHGQPLLHFADGDTAPADLVVFADGRASTGRRLLDPHRQLRYAGYVAHRGQASTAQPGLLEFLRFEPSHSGMQFNVAGAENAIRAGQAAFWYSCRSPPSRSCRRMLRCVSVAGSVIGSGSGR